MGIRVACYSGGIKLINLAGFFADFGSFLSKNSRFPACFSARENNAENQNNKKKLLENVLALCIYIRKISESYDSEDF